MGEERQVVFNISRDMDSTVSRSILTKISNTAVGYADWNVKNKLSYDFIENQIMGNMIFISDSLFHVSVEGMASNVYGTKGKVTAMFEFDMEGNILKDENGLPIVLSFED